MTGTSSHLRLILASGSAGRRELLEKAGWPFEVIPSGVEEPDGKDVTDPRAFVQDLAWRKAAAVARAVSTPALVVAADSVVWHEGAIIGKPTDLDDARCILSRLAGTTHELWTGVCVWRTSDGIQVCWQEVSRVRFKSLSAEELENLLATGDWQGKSGGYGIQGDADPYLTVETGTISNVIGLPMETLTKVRRLLESDFTQ
jgi:septum formation protein